MHFTGTVYRNPYWPTWPVGILSACTGRSIIYRTALAC